MHTTKCYVDKDAHLASLVCLQHRLPQLWPAPPAECLEILQQITITVMTCYLNQPVHNRFNTCQLCPTCSQTLIESTLVTLHVRMLTHPRSHL